MVKHVLKGNTHIINNLESIAYILNLRGNDVPYTPVFLAYLVFHGNNVYLFMDGRRLDKRLIEKLYDDGIIVRPYDSYYKFLDSITSSKIIIDENKVNYETYVHINRNNNILYNHTIYQEHFYMLFFLSGKKSDSFSPFKKKGRAFGKISP